MEGSDRSVKGVDDRVGRRDATTAYGARIYGEGNVDKFHVGGENGRAGGWEGSIVA